MNDDIANGRAAVRERLKALSAVDSRLAHRIFTEHCNGADRISMLTAESCKAILAVLNTETETTYKLGLDQIGDPVAAPVAIPREATAEYLNTHPDSSLGAGAVDVPNSHVPIRLSDKEDEQNRTDVDKFNMGDHPAGQDINVPVAKHLSNNCFTSRMYRGSGLRNPFSS
jgi:hypothetical protein